MSVKFFILNIIIFISMSSFCQKKEDIYIKHNVDTKETILYSNYRDGRDKHEIEYTQRFSMGVFSYFDQYFQVKPNSVVGEVTEEDLGKSNVVKIDYFLRKREATKETQLADPNDLFNKIYIIVPNINYKYFKFEVSWVQMYF